MAAEPRTQEMSDDLEAAVGDLPIFDGIMQATDDTADTLRATEMYVWRRLERQNNEMIALLTQIAANTAP